MPLLLGAPGVLVGPVGALGPSRLLLLLNRPLLSRLLACTTTRAGLQAMCLGRLAGAAAALSCLTPSLLLDRAPVCML